MKSRLNTNPGYSPRRSFKTESLYILQSLAKACTETSDPAIITKILEAKDKFSQVCNSFNTLTDNLKDNIKFLSNNSKEITKSCIKIRTNSEKKLARQRKVIENKENHIKTTQKNLNKSLGSIQKLWAKNLKTMKSRLKNQIALKNQLKKNFNSLDKGKNLNLSEALNFSYSEKHGKSIDKELISHESAFLCISEHTETKPPLQVQNMHTGHQSNYSLEFEKCMAELESQRQPQDDPLSISIEKSIGGWKSEYDSDSDSVVNQVTPNDVKSAVLILRKANLLGKKKSSVLKKINNLLKIPGNTNKIELLLQLNHLEYKPQEFSAINSQKPPLKGNKSLKEQDFEATPKANFAFPDDIDMSKTILSLENPLSARRKDDSFELLDSIDGSSQDFHDVLLEDLLKIPYIVAELKTVTGDMVIGDNEIQDSEVLSSVNRGSLSYISILSPTEVKLKSPIKKQTTPSFDCQSTGISSHSGLRSRITLKTGCSENSQ
ncbi:hypothetical protein SteCoe_34017 [Stentor coeruleus]|uniref:Uncharacterized protein n=1 Tax=Stentor coeruleus TaxID=5963 RepID=A0A1R2AVG6_9CILI|nr:hypothetical protein SteCoe_34017 [Stentor coeruleus]